MTSALKEEILEQEEEANVAFRLQTLSPCPLTVSWHENKSLYLRIDKEGRRLSFHLHRLFLKAPSPVLEALVRYGLKGKAQDRTILRQMANLFFSQYKAPPEPLDPLGHAYDLKNIFERHEAVYFPKGIQAQIGWFDIPKYKKFRSITFGTYDRSRSQIKLNRLLDSPHVPSYFVEFIVYHEMLHAVCQPTIDRDGRTIVHTAEFRRREKLFAHFEIAKEWEKQSIQFFKKRIRHGRS
ncbi:MAG: hypothetical protein JSS32_10080 [Verrucomicrobia bacterium]|nr:hypothetical protein [Verrucomicrobiota bacterium]